MSKTRDTGFLGNVIKVDTSGNVSFVSGSTTLATINTSGQLSGSSPVLSSSYALNADLLDGLDSTQFTLTSSFAAQTASFTAFTASVNSFTASQLVLNGTYATTGSNTFTGIQTINSNLVVTGSITAQTLVVQTITSSVDFVTGSTRFGSLSSNTHIITGSMFVTGAFYVTTGSVGIGTSSPSALLHIEGNAGGAGYTTYQNFLFFKNTNTANSSVPSVNLFVAGDGDGLGVEFVSNGTVTSNGSAVTKGYANRSSGHFRISNLATSGSEFIFRTAVAGSTTQVNRMYIDSSGNTTFSGNVGIGTTTTPSGGISGTEVALEISNSNVAVLALTSTAASGKKFQIYSSNDGGLFFRDATAGSQRMNITSGGNVVIGNTTGYGGLTISDFTSNDGNDSLSFFYRGTSGAHQSLIKFYDFRGQLNSSMGNELHDDTSGTPKARMVFKTSNGSSPVERMRISSEGIITAPFQVSFKAYPGSFNPELAKSTTHTIPYNAEEYDTQGNFSTSTYKFTAPVAGKYLFTVNFNAYGLDDTARLTLSLYINSSSTRNLYNFANLPTGNTGDTNISASDILNLAAGNTVEVRVYTDGSGTFNLSNGQTYNSFSGHLLG
jgi:hypothetical protein